MSNIAYTKFYAGPYARALYEVVEANDALSETLDDEQSELFEEFMTAQREVNVLTDCETFYGFLQRTFSVTFSCYPVKVFCFGLCIQLFSQFLQMMNLRCFRNMPL